MNWPTQSSVYRDESLQTNSGQLTSHGCAEDDASQRTFISVKINYNTKDYSKKSYRGGRYKVCISSMCRHVGAELLLLHVLFTECHRDITKSWHHCVAAELTCNSSCFHRFDMKNSWCTVYYLQALLLCWTACGPNLSFIRSVSSTWMRATKNSSFKN